MIRWTSGFLLVGAALSLSGCFYLSGQFETRVEPVSERISSMNETISVPGSEVVSVQATLDGSMLAIEASLDRACSPTLFETWQNYDKHTEHLPASHWALFSGGLATAGGGGALLGLGMLYSQAPAATAVHDASVESMRDTGNIMLITGAVAATLGVAMLTSELIDWIMLKERREPTDKVIKPFQSAQAPCPTEPAKKHAVMIETLPSGSEMTRRVTLMTDDFGRASIDLRDEAFDAFPYGDPFATITCKDCSGWNLTLLPDSAAALAIHRNDQEALSGWAEAYGAESTPELIGQVKEAKVRRDVVAIGDAITFPTGSSKLRRSAGKHLDEAAEFLLKRRNLQLRIEGHTDNTGNEKKNRELSKKRAEAVKRYLVQRGVPADRLITVGMASSQPVKSNKNSSGRKANRRYQFQLLED